MQYIGRHNPLSIGITKRPFLFLVVCSIFSWILINYRLSVIAMAFFDPIFSYFIVLA